MKYILRKDLSITFAQRTLYRIQRVSNGEIGGYVESEKNLSQDDDSWISDNAKVYDNAKVFDKANVSGDAWIYGNSKIYEKARISGSVQIRDNAKIYGNAWVYGNAKISNDTEISGDSRITGHSTVSHDAKVERKKECINIIGLPFNITITKNHIEIGCIQKEHSEWLNTIKSEAKKRGFEEKEYEMLSIVLKQLTNYVKED